MRVSVSTPALIYYYVDFDGPWWVSIPPALKYALGLARHLQGAPVTIRTYRNNQITNPGVSIPEDTGVWNAVFGG